MPDINGSITQRDVDDAFFVWRRAAERKPPDIPVINAFWHAYCRIDKELKAQEQRRSQLM